ncbi:MAG: FGGY family carbohydrate kinase [Thermomicrobiales bacterium]
MRADRRRRRTGVAPPLWNETSAADDAERLNQQADFAAAVGSRLVSAFTIAKLAHLQRTEPESIARASAVGLPHDWLNLQLTGNLVTDRGDASGSGWWSPETGQVRHDLLELALGAETAARIALPRVLGSNEPAGELLESAAIALGLPAGLPVGPGTSDNMAAALVSALNRSSFVVSLGTSGTAYAVTDHATHDETGIILRIRGRDRPLPSARLSINCTRTVDAIARLADSIRWMRSIRRLRLNRAPASCFWNPGSAASGRRTCPMPPRCCTA